ncbi:hypothetical protein CC85DRAFT_322216 [Cutaneotrichosporon oleaginosum]|uniref:C2H2-type domain-containing protein n=1 Tax=Cutaneotrichosporon oleaginosum TaxID=879819 RepID=A0A0J0XGB7_9TREE|nr:uncharacterized protein CC85DRAFT_322216 [Cutaneotrichosporon oleaginosum]KLT40103.1 hypothetical protein CC85DRAFT_322216 [Cutaneotrichosporon oleaginosum]TXT04742.1 hypothetical protein COLE_07561 [Cutaneotrichosporon oleaginosum]
MPQQHLQNEEKRRQAEIQKQRRHVCPVCDKRFNRPSSLNTHMSVHTGAKPYQCLREGCGRRFSVSSNLRRHERPQLDYAMPSAGLRDYAVVGSGVNANTNAGAGASGTTPAMNMGIVAPPRRESAPSYYQTTPAPSPTPPQLFQSHKSMST